MYLRDGNWVTEFYHALTRYRSMSFEFEPSHLSLDGKRHYGDGLYKEAAGILGYTQGALRNFKSLSDQIQMSWRHDKLSWQHHYELSSIKKTVTNEKTDKLELSKDTKGRKQA